MKKTISALAIAALFAVTVESCNSTYDEFEADVAVPENQAPNQDGNSTGDPDGGD